jgi:hypothetical protein
MVISRASRPYKARRVPFAVLVLFPAAVLLVEIGLRRADGIPRAVLVGAGVLCFAWALLATIADHPALSIVLPMLVLGSWGDAVSDVVYGNDATLSRRVLVAAVVSAVTVLPTYAASAGYIRFRRSRQGPRAQKKGLDDASS